MVFTRDSGLREERRFGNTSTRFTASQGQGFQQLIRHGGLAGVKVIERLRQQSHGTMTDPLTIRCGDAIRELRKLGPESVRCCVTSPPYWKLREYGFDGQIGMEPTPQRYINKLVRVFRAVRRVLAADGTLWVNIGDTYCTTPNTGVGWDSSTLTKADGRPRKIQVAQEASSRAKCRQFSYGPGVKLKDMVGIPWMLAFALRKDGWWLRSEVIWHKPNATPESCKDRPTRAHETIFLLAKSARYWYDHEAIREPPSAALLEQIAAGYDGRNTKDFMAAGAQPASDVKRRIIEGHRKRMVRTPSTWDTGLGSHDGMVGRYGRGKWTEQGEQFRSKRMADNTAAARAADGDHDNPFGLGSNKRTVWRVNTKGFVGAHFATFPPDLIRPCILAGSASGDAVLDPFAGSGTTGLVAIEEGRRAVLIDGNPDYMPIIKERCSGITVGLKFPEGDKQTEMFEQTEVAI